MLESRMLLSVSFPPPLGYAGINAFRVAVADLNGDGKPDMVVIGNSDTNALEAAIYVNKGNRTFGTPIILPFPGKSIDAVAIGDFNGDGVPDIAVASFEDAAVYVYLGAGVNVGGAVPSYLPPVATTYGTPFTGGDGLVTMQTGHFGGSSAGLVVTDSTDAKTLVLVGFSGGHFGTVLPIKDNNGQFVTRLGVVADFNGDGISDIAYSGGLGVDVQFGTSGGAFLTGVNTYAIPGGTPAVMTAGVLTSSGKPDLIVGGSATTGTPETAGIVDVLLNNGGGSFAPAVTYSLGYEPNSIALGAFDGTAIDVATEDLGGNLDIFTNSGSGTLSPPTTFPLDSGIVLQMVGADLNGDGKADIAATGADGFVGADHQSDSVGVFIEGGSSTGGGGGAGGSGSITPTISAKLPASAIGGSKVKDHFTISLKDTSGSAFKGKETVRLYLSPDGALADATQIATGSKAANLKNGKATTLALTVTSIPSLTAGAYTLLAVATDPSGNSTTSTGQSITVAPPFVKTTVSALRSLSSKVIPGKKTSLSFTLTNTGNTTATGTASLVIDFSTDPGGSNAISIATVPVKIKLKANSHATFKASFPIPLGISPGAQYLVGLLDVAVLGDSTATDGRAVSAATLTVS